jgi:hypothetical protein
MRARRSCAHVGSSRTTKSLQIHPGPANITANGLRYMPVSLDGPFGILLQGSSLGSKVLAGQLEVWEGVRP